MSADVAAAARLIKVYVSFFRAHYGVAVRKAWSRLERKLEVKHSSNAGLCCVRERSAVLLNDLTRDRQAKPAAPRFVSHARFENFQSFRNAVAGICNVQTQPFIAYVTSER